MPLGYERGLRFGSGKSSGNESVSGIPSAVAVYRVLMWAAVKGIPESRAVLPECDDLARWLGYLLIAHGKVDPNDPVQDSSSRRWSASAVTPNIVSPPAI